MTALESERFIYILALVDLRLFSYIFQFVYSRYLRRMPPPVSSATIQVIKRLRSEGTLIRKIAANLKVAKSTVQLVIKRRYSTVHVQTGRKPLLSSRQERKLVMDSKRNPFMIANKLLLSQNLGNIASVDTVK